MKKRNWGKKALATAMGLVVILGFVWGYRSISHPMISVVMSTYNRAENYLPKAIDSILNQTYGDFEFIIINDGSPDNTAEVLEEYRRKDSRIRIITNEKNLGLIPSLNKGFDAARGKYIARMDDDDISLPTRFEKQIHYLESRPELTATGCLFKDVETNYLHKYPEDTEDAKSMSFILVPVAHGCLMIQNDFLKKNRIRYREGFNGAEDLDFFFDVVIKNGGLVSTIQEVLYLRFLGSPKKKNYYGEQGESTYRFFREGFGYFLSKKKLKCNNFYECYRALYENELSKGLMDQDTLRKWYEKRFLSNNSIVLNGAYGIGVFQFEGKDRIVASKAAYGQRLGLSQSLIKDSFSSLDSLLIRGKVLDKEFQSITIKWDNGKIENFLYRNDTKMYHQYLNLYHKNWKEKFIYEGYNRLVAYNHFQDSATILEKGKDFIKLKWDHYGTEKFMYNAKDRTYYWKEIFDKKKMKNKQKTSKKTI